MRRSNGIRWSDSDRFFGPFTVAFDKYRPTAVMLSSQDDEDRPASIRVQIAGLTILAPLPGWLIRPKRTKVQARYWSANDIARIGRDWYWNIDEREFGFILSDGALHIHYGAQTNEWPGSKSKVFFYPWRQWRLVRHTLFDCEGRKHADLPPFNRLVDTWEQRRKIKDSCPIMRFRFLDFDGEEITATARLEEYEHKRGEGRWKWLSWFSRATVKRSLDLEFSSEVGKRKGSWKGGTVGHSITLRPGEGHETGFRRYCKENGLSFVGLVSEAAE